MASILVSGSRSRALAEKVREYTQLPLANVDSKRFLDGEQYFRIMNDVTDQKVFVLQSLYPNPDEALVELLFLMEASVGGGAEEVIPIIPYLAYSRQDKRNLYGEALSAEVVLNPINDYCKRLLTFDCHFHRRPGNFNLCGLKVKNLSAVELLLDAASYMLESPIVVSPDIGMVPALGSVHKLGFEALEKQRSAKTGDVKTMFKKIKCRGKDVAILDDIIATGSTVGNAAEILRMNGARRIYAFCTHGIFANMAVEKMVMASIDNVVCTDSIETDHSKVSLARPIADQIIKITEKEK